MKTQKLYEVEHWNENAEKFETVVVLAHSEYEAKRKVGIKFIRPVSEFK